MEYFAINKFEDIIRKIKYMKPYSNGITETESHILLLWDENWILQINKKLNYFDVVLCRNGINKSIYRYISKSIYFLDNKNGIEKNVIKSLVLKRFKQIEKDYTEYITSAFMDEDLIEESNI